MGGSQSTQRNTTETQREHANNIQNDATNVNKIRDKNNQMEAINAPVMDDSQKTVCFCLSLVNQ